MIGHYVGTAARDVATVRCLLGRTHNTGQNACPWIKIGSTHLTTLKRDYIQTVTLGRRSTLVVMGGVVEVEMRASQRMVMEVVVVSRRRNAAAARPRITSRPKYAST